jgi:hypothetical protein
MEKLNISNLKQVVEAYENQINEHSQEIKKHEETVKELWMQISDVSVVGWAGVLLLNEEGSVISIDTEESDLNFLNTGVHRVYGMNKDVCNEQGLEEEKRFRHTYDHTIGQFVFVPTPAEMWSLYENFETTSGVEYHRQIFRGGRSNIFAFFDKKIEAEAYIARRHRDFKRRTILIRKIAQQVQTTIQTCALCHKPFRLESEPRIHKPNGLKFNLGEYIDNGYYLDHCRCLARWSSLVSWHNRTLKCEFDEEQIEIKALLAILKEILEANAFGRTKKFINIPVRVPLGSLYAGETAVATFYAVLCEWERTPRQSIKQMHNIDWRLTLEAEVPDDATLLDQHLRYVKNSELLERVVNQDYQGLELVTK